MTNEDAIRYAMSCHGPVQDVRLVRDKATNQSRCFCFVEYTSVAAATAAVRACVSGCIIDNTNVRVTFSRDSGPAHEDERGRRGGRGGVPTRPPNISEGFVWDKKSQLWFDPSSNYYYDSTTQLYFHSQTGFYYRWDIMTNSYMQVDERGVRVEDAALELKKAEEAAKKKKREAKKAAKLVASSTAHSEVSELIVPRKKEAKKVQMMKIGSLGGIKFNLNAVKNSVAADLNKWKSKAEKIPGTIHAAPAVKSSPFISAAPTTNDVANMAPVDCKPDLQPETATEKQSMPVRISSTPTSTSSLESKQDAAPKAMISRDKWINIKQRACLLCKRQFKAVETLRKHVAESALHKKNLQIEEFKVMQKQQASAAARTVAQAKNIKMRENKFEQMVLEAARREEERVAEDAKNKVNVPIESSNKGNKMLKAMGWKEGQGLGKNESGIVAPVQANLRTEGAGIGIPGSAVTAGSDYKTAARMKNFDRFNDNRSSGPSTTADKQDAASAYLQMMQQHNNSSCSSDRENRPLVK